MSTLAQTSERRKDPLLSAAHRLARSQRSLHRQVRVMAASRDDLRALVRGLEEALRHRVAMDERTELERDLLRKAQEVAS